jgi:poly(beta-D-mannuronate) lyase
MTPGQNPRVILGIAIAILLVASMTLPSLTGIAHAASNNLTVNAVSISDGRILNMWTVIRSGGATVHTGFTPVAYTGNTGSTYIVTLSDYGNLVFDHWNDGSTIRSKTITLSADAIITAYYKTNTITSPPPSDTSSQSDGVPAAIRTLNVNSIDQLMTAIGAAKPGDHIIMTNGNYDDTSWLTSHSTKNLLIKGIKGTASAPIVIQAQSIGGVEIRGAGGFRLYDVANIIIQGFKFTHSQDNSRYSDDAAIQCHMCDFVRFTRNQFELTTSLGSSAEWLSITSEVSDHNRIDHNVFKNKSTKGVFILIFGGNGDMAKYNRIDHNYFYNQYYSAGNGGECLRIGNSERGLKNAYTTVEYNLFEKCNGDMEAVTVKSSSNTFKANTFRGNQGSLTFRHGNNNVADGNFFLDGKNGIRSYGHDHKIINNYFGSLSGTGSLAPLVIGSGSIEEDLNYSNSQHSRSKNVLVAFNTFYNNQNTYLRLGENFRTLPPQYITVDHNILVGSSGRLVNFDRGEYITWTKNILYGSASKGNMPTSGYTIVDPKLTLKATGIYGLTSTSPAIDRASSTSYPSVSIDMDGQTRSGMKDTGADEYSTQPVVMHPLVSSDVGPNSK